MSCFINEDINQMTKGTHRIKENWKPSNFYDLTVIYRAWCWWWNKMREIEAQGIKYTFSLDMHVFIYYILS